MTSRKSEAIKGSACSQGKWAEAEVQLQELLLQKREARTKNQTPKQSAIPGTVGHIVSTGEGLQGLSWLVREKTRWRRSHYFFSFSFLILKGSKAQVLCS